MAYLSTEDLSEIVIKTLPGLMDEGSALVAAGTTNIAYDTTDIRKMQISGPAVVAEGASKPMSNPDWEMEKVRTLKLVQAMVVTEEFLDTSEGKKMAAEAVGKYLASFPKGIDIAVLNGTNPRTGEAVSAYATDNLKDNATQFSSSDPALIDQVIASAIYGIDEAEYLLLSREGFNQVSSLRTVTDGLQKYRLDRNRSFDFSSVEASTFRSVGMNGWNPGRILNSNLAMAGDFSKIGMAFQAPTVRIGREGTFNGENLLQDNKIAYIIEQKVKFYVDEPESFAVIKDTSV